MKLIPKRLRQIRPGKIWGLTAIVVLWAVMLLGVAVPSWRRVHEQHAEIGQIETQLADLDRWTVAGLWLEPAVSAREPGIEAARASLFPPVRDREQLFLELARAADEAQVREFQLEEMGGMDSASDVSYSSTDGAAGDAGAGAGPTGDAPPADGAVAGPISPPVQLNFGQYRVRAAFVADYAATADFLNELERIERAVRVRNLAIRPVRTGVAVELELEVPVSEPVSS